MRLLFQIGIKSVKNMIVYTSYVSVATEKKSVEITLAEKPKIKKNLAESCAEKTESWNGNLKNFAWKLIGKRITFLGNGIFSVC